MKLCPKCNKLLPHPKFYSSPKTHDNLSSYCKSCSLKYSAQWRKEHLERTKTLQEHWRNKHRKPKTCLRCKTSLPKETIGRLCPICKANSKTKTNANERARRKRNEPKWRKNRLEQFARRKKRHLEFINTFKTQHPCICGEADPVALDCHHINPNEKNGLMSRIAKQSLIKIQEELNKCIIICANCHRKGHAGHPRPEHQPYFLKEV